MPSTPWIGVAVLGAAVLLVLAWKEIERRRIIRRQAILESLRRQDVLHAEQATRKFFGEPEDVDIAKEVINHIDWLTNQRDTIIHSLGRETTFTFPAIGFRRVIYSADDYDKMIKDLRALADHFIYYAPNPYLR